MMRLLFAAILILLSPHLAHAASCRAPDGFANAELLEALKRGVNLPGWDHPEPERRPTLAQLRAVRGAGFTHVRLPLDNRPLQGADAGRYVDAIREQLVFLLSLGFAVSLDLHPDGRVRALFERDPAEAQDYLSSIWRRLAPVARSFDPGRVAVELLNEPETGQDEWMAAAGRLIREIRAVLPDHTIIVGPSGPQRHETLSGMTPFADRNIVYAVHYYDPFIFTHQGLTWGDENDPVRRFSGLPFPADAGHPAIAENLARLRAEGRTEAVSLLERMSARPWDEAYVAEAFDMMAGWADEHSRPVIVNEFGVLDFEAPRQSRLDWLETVARLAEARCIGWTHWDFQDGFGLVDRETGMPDPEIVRRLIP